MRRLILSCVGFCYRHIAKKIFFRQDPEHVHERITDVGEELGKTKCMRRTFSFIFNPRRKELSQTLFGIRFKNPIGLAAGFDYEARLTQILPSFGFGFGTVGTLTHLPYGGNPRPMLGRLPKSRSLLVNKGFKNLGVQETLHRLRGVSFAYPLGVSIGRTNAREIKTQEDAVEDILQGFRSAENSSIPFSYYELNISCPNLLTPVEFYEPEHLGRLLDALEKLKISRPVFAKMPISKTDAEVRAMMDVIVTYPFIKAVIFGNLQCDRDDPSFDREEVQKCGKGNFSGIPCQGRSDELIRFVFENYGSPGGVFFWGGGFIDRGG